VQVSRHTGEQVQQRMAGENVAQVTGQPQARGLLEQMAEPRSRFIVKKDE
jgi:hypothetical protein